MPGRRVRPGAAGHDARMTKPTIAPLARGQLRRRIAPFRVKPGSEVKLESDFDPGFKEDFVAKSDATVALAEGAAQLGDY
jgi:hypothetical protein